MRGLQVLPLSKSLVVRIADAVRRFSCCSSQSKNTAYLSPSNPPPVPLIDKNLPYERYSETVRQLRPLFPSTCTLLKPGEVKVIGDTPIGAEGFADIWDGTLNGHRVIQVAYRCYETGEVEHIFRRYLREVSACSQLSHPNIVPFVGINPTPNHPFTLVFGTAGYVGLNEYLCKNPKTDRLKLIQGIARGLEYLHDRGIVHGHLGPENILIDPDGSPRIARFSSSYMITRPDLWSDERDVAGFHRGSAPELMRPHRRGEPTIQITKASDMYAFGMLAWQIFSGNDPFPGDLDVTVVQRVSEGDRPPRPGHAGLSDRMWKMVKACWHDVPSRRMKVGEVVALIERDHFPPVPKRPN